MARKRVEKPIVVAATRPVRLDLEPEVHRLLRLVAADSEQSMASYAREVLHRHLRGEAERRGIRARERGASSPGPRGKE